MYQNISDLIWLISVIFFLCLWVKKVPYVRLPKINIFISSFIFTVFFTDIFNKMTTSLQYCTSPKRSFFIITFFTLHFIFIDIIWPSILLSKSKSDKWKSEKSICYDLFPMFLIRFPILKRLIGNSINHYMYNVKKSGLRFSANFVK